MKTPEAPLADANIKRRKLLSISLILTHVILTVFVALMVGLHGLYLFQEETDKDTHAQVNILTEALSNYMQQEIQQEQRLSAEAALDTHIQSLLDTVERETGICMYLFSDTGTCITFSGKDASANAADIILPAEICHQLLESTGSTSSVDVSRLLNPEDTRPVSCYTSVFSIQDADGRDSQYLLFANTYQNCIDHFISVTMIIAIAVVLISVALFAAAYVFHSRKRSNAIRAITDALDRCAHGDYTTELAPYSYPIPQYTETALIVNQMMRELKEMDDQQSEFVSNVSHELRTPMTIISGYVDGILDGTVPKARRMEYLTIVSQEMQRLKILITSMLNLTKLDHGTIQMKCDYFSIRDMVFRTILMFESRLEKKEITVEGLDGTERIHVYGDYDLIGQVVYNYIENAVKFVDVGGTISFRFENIKDAVIFAVRNTGAGIKKDELSRVFDRFFKSDFSRSADKTGLGLGLNISQRILRLHNAQTRVTSEENVFTEFEITFPNGPKSEEQPAAKPESSTANSIG